eukprot:TRINITY_DN774153_c0_g1_i1.p1 TRINITY_DN774153_c0_g1~~TRINITY_DN774153_c0_g1_i1.p1  ORF type:complete len:532 (-),score=156.13 TRINITY_DN774153_c0_g1_i1:154-1749(-)
MMMKLLALFALLAVVFCADVVRVDKLDKVPMGSHYTQKLPTVTDPKMFDGKTAAVVIGNYVEDIEVLFPYTYLAQRGAKIDIICTEGLTKVLAGDFTKPTWILQCTGSDKVTTEQWKSYDIMVVPGGAGIYFVRNDEKIIKGLNAFMTTLDTKEKTKVFAPICAGAEICIDVDCITRFGNDKTIAGSPTSSQVLIDAGFDYKTDLVVSHGRIIVGHNPEAHSEWTQAIGKLMSGKTEPLSANDPYKFVDTKVFVDCPNNLDDMRKDFSYGAKDYYKTLTIPTIENLKGKNVAVIASRGSSWNEYAYMKDAFAKNGANVKVYCTWMLQGDYGNAQEFKNGMIPTAYVPCDGSINAAITAEIVVIPSGIWANTVLRNNNDVSTIINKAETVITLGEAAEQLARVNVAATRICDVTTASYGKNYLKNKVHRGVFTKGFSACAGPYYKTKSTDGTSSHELLFISAAGPAESKTAVVDAFTALNTRYNVDGKGSKSNNSVGFIAIALAVCAFIAALFAARKTRQSSDLPVVYSDLK